MTGLLTWRWAAVIATLVLFGSAAAVLVHMEWNGLPYHDRFAEGLSSEWKLYGGNWSVASDELTNASDDIGAKSVTGSVHLTDVVMDADVRLTSSVGDAGLIVRVSNEEEGTNAFDGYYAGIRLPDQLILSRMDFGFIPLRRVRISEGVEPGVWYHLKVSAQGCDVSAEARDMNGTVLAHTQVHEESACMRHGRFGLRSFAAGGSWRSVQVRAHE